jgi:hypothetical protein
MYCQWCNFGPAELDGPPTVVTKNEVFLSPESPDPAAAKRAREPFAPRAATLANALDGRDYLLEPVFRPHG